MSTAIRHSTVSVNGITLHVAETRAADGRCVILLHGFPEPWSAWRPIMAGLSEAGWRVLVPDQRGYNASDKPAQVHDYAIDVLARDVVGLIDWTGRAPAAVVGHDWGGIVAWWVAQCYPERVQRLAVLNAPHPLVFRRYLPRHPAQLLRSWYTFYFQLPMLPEAGFRRNHWYALARTLERTSRPGTFPEPLLQEYRAAWSQPGAMTAMIHWYRAAIRYPPRCPSHERVQVPTLLIWGARDAFLARGLAVESRTRCDDARIEWFEDATHWVHHEEPERVTELLTEFLRSI